MPDFPYKNGPDDFAAIKAIAAAADISVTAPAIRNCERRGVLFMCFEILIRVEVFSEFWSMKFHDKYKNVKAFDITFS